MKHDETIYLQHILDAIVRIADYLAGVDEAEFSNQPLIQDAVIRQLEIIGEATKHLSASLRGRYPHIPWQDIAGMRDRLIHHYFGVDIDTVWLTAHQDVPELKNDIVAMLDELRSKR